MIYFIAIDTYKYQPRTWYGMKKWWKEKEVRPLTISILSEDESLCEAYLFQNKKNDDIEWIDSRIKAYEYDGPFSEKEIFLLIGDTPLRSVEAMVEERQVTDLLNRKSFDLTGRYLMLDNVDFERRLYRLAENVPDEEFDHSNDNYPNAINPIPGLVMPVDIKVSMLQEHKDWKHTAPGDFSLDRCKKIRSNYLLLKSILAKYR